MSYCEHNCTYSTHCKLAQILDDPKVESDAEEITEALWNYDKCPDFNYLSEVAIDKFLKLPPLRKINGKKTYVKVRISDTRGITYKSDIHRDIQTSQFMVDRGIEDEDMKKALHIAWTLRAKYGPSISKEQFEQYSRRVEKIMVKYEINSFDDETIFLDSLQYIIDLWEDLHKTQI